MGKETNTNLKTALGVVGLLAVWIDPAALTWVLFAAIGLWTLAVPVRTDPVGARLRKRS